MHGPKPDNHCVRQHHSKPLRQKNHHIIHHSPRSCTSSFPSWRRLINLISSSTHFAARNFFSEFFGRKSSRGNMEAESLYISKLRNCLFEGTTITSASRFSTEGEDGHWIKRLKPNFPHEIVFCLFFCYLSFSKKKCRKNSRF